MPRRKAGAILPLEVSILEHGLQSETFYGFGLARAIADSDSGLTAHGTLYKALSRMTAAGLLAAEWEAPELAEAEGRPRRRLYRVTGEGQRTLATSQVPQRIAVSTSVSLA